MYISESFITSLSEGYNYKIKKSGAHGKGVFAKMDMWTDVNLGLAFKKVGSATNPDQAYKRFELGKYMNHSDKSNVRWAANGKDYYFVTSRKIKKGEELTIDYNSIPWEGKLINEVFLTYLMRSKRVIKKILKLRNADKYKIQSIEKGLSKSSEKLNQLNKARKNLILKIRKSKGSVNKNFLEVPNLKSKLAGVRENIKQEITKKQDLRIELRKIRST